MKIINTHYSIMLLCSLVGAWYCNTLQSEWSWIFFIFTISAVLIGALTLEMIEKGLKSYFRTRTQHQKHKGNLWN